MIFHVMNQNRHRLILGQVNNDILICYLIHLIDITCYVILIKKYIHNMIFTRLLFKVYNL